MIGADHAPTRSSAGNAGKSLALTGIVRCGIENHIGYAFAAGKAAANQVAGARGAAARFGAMYGFTHQLAPAAEAKPERCAGAHYDLAARGKPNLCGFDVARASSCRLTPTRSSAKRLAGQFWHPAGSGGRLQLQPDCNRVATAKPFRTFVFHERLQSCSRFLVRDACARIRAHIREGNSATLQPFCISVCNHKVIGCTSVADRLQLQPVFAVGAGMAENCRFLNILEGFYSASPALTASKGVKPEGAAENFGAGAARGCSSGRRAGSSARDRAGLGAGRRNGGKLPFWSGRLGYVGRAMLDVSRKGPVFAGRWASGHKLVRLTPWPAGMAIERRTAQAKAPPSIAGARPPVPPFAATGSGSPIAREAFGISSDLINTGHASAATERKMSDGRAGSGVGFPVRWESSCVAGTGCVERCVGVLRRAIEPSVGGHCVN